MYQKGSQDSHPSNTSALNPSSVWAPGVAERTMELASSSVLSWTPDSLGEPANLLGSLFPPLGHRIEPILPTAQG